MKIDKDTFWDFPEEEIKTLKDGIMTKPISWEEIKRECAKCLSGRLYNGLKALLATQTTQRETLVKKIKEIGQQTDSRGYIIRPSALKDIIDLINE